MVVKTSILFQVIEAVGVNPFKDLSLSIRPLHFDFVDPCCLSQSEVEAQITLRQIASSASDLSHLLHLSCGHKNARV